MTTRLPLPTCMIIAFAALTLTACQPAADPQVAAQEQAAAQERQAEALAAQFDEQFAQKNWRLAAAHGDILMAEHPDSTAAARIKEQHAEARSRASETTEASRTAALWSYQTEPVEDGEQLSAAIYARDNIETDGKSATPVRLIFRDHPDWGRSAYLTLEAGDFDCYGGCKVQVFVDDGKPKSMAASRPDTDEAIAMFIEDEPALWRLLDGAKTVAIEFPVKAGGKRTAVFEVAGLKPAKMPGW